MSTAIKRSYCLENILQGGTLCKSPVINWEAPSCITVECISSDKRCIEVEILPGCTDHCITVTIDCDDCDQCDSVTKEICFCVDSDDCTGPCEYCDNGICKTFCPDGKLCINDTCVDCVTNAECDCNQQCIQGSCQCPAGQLQRIDGCCVDCIDNSHCGSCEICVNGTCVPKECPGGHCHPITGNCQECVTNSHCTESNTCCVGGECDCCPGYYRDPITQICVVLPPCFSADDCPPCHDCVDGQCVLKVCPDGLVCDPATDTCVPDCTTGDCPEDYGCINGMCIPCSELSCTSQGLQCQFAVGCHCVDGECEGIDCDVSGVSLVWGEIPGSTGTITDPGLPPLQGTWNIVAGNVTTTPPIYRDFNFTFTVPNGASGVWRRYDSPTNFTALNSTSNSVSFSLSDTNPLNLWGFVVEFVESGTGRTARFGAYANPSLTLTDPTRFSNANVQFSAQGIPPSTVGGSPDTITLCSNNADFILLSATGQAVSGDITIAFFQGSNGCLNAIVNGCGTWIGTAQGECGGNVFNIPIPEFTIPLTACCSPNDPNCDYGTGSPCTAPTITNIPLIAHPTYGIVDGGSNDGDGEYTVIADWISAGLTFFDIFYLNVSSGCWSTGPNTTISGNPNDVNLNTGPLGTSPFLPSVNVTMGDGGCVFFGHTCDLRIPGCKRLQGSVCLDACNDFHVIIVARPDLGANTYIAYPSLESDTIAYRWTYPNGNTLIGTSQTVTITPVGGSSTLRVLARLGNPVRCEDTDTLSLNTQLQGCTDPQACNYDASATQDDSSCVVVGTPTYSCSQGFLGSQTSAATAEGQALVDGIVYRFASNNNPITPGQGIAPGDYTVNIYLDGNLSCSKNLSVPQCWSCNQFGNCVASTNNLGGHPSQSQCEALCGCSVTMNIQPQACSGRKRSFAITPSGGSGGTFILGIQDSSNAVVWSQSGVVAGATITSPALCNGNYQIIVSEGSVLNDDCTSTNMVVDCNCSTSGLDIVTVASTDQGSTFCNTGSLAVTIAPDQCSLIHTLSLYSGTCASHNILAHASQSFNGITSQQSVNFNMALPSDGAYALQLFGSAGPGCLDCVDVVVNCGGAFSCDISGLTVNVETNNGSQVQIGGTVVLGETGTNNYRAELYQINGACTTPIVGTLINSPGVLLSGTGGPVPFSVTGTHNGSTTCFGVRIVKVGVPTCREDAARTIPVNVQPDCAPGTIAFFAYNTGTQTLPVYFSAPFTGTVGGVNIYVQVANSSTCNTGVDLFVNDSGDLVAGPVPFLWGWGGDGTQNVPIDQIPGSARCITVTAVNAADDPGLNFDTTSPTGCYTQISSVVVPSCTCSIAITNTEYSVVGSEIIIEYDAFCYTDPIANGLLFELEECTSPTCASCVAIDSFVESTVDGFVAFSPIAQDPSDTYYRILVEDLGNPSCNTSHCFTVPGSCPASVEIQDQITTCNYSINFRHPSTAILNRAEPVVVQDALFEVNVDTELVESCTGDIVDTGLETVAPIRATKSQSTIASLLQDGIGEMSSIRVHHLDPAGPTETLYTIPLAPGTADLATVHVVNAADLVFNAASPTTLETALLEVIENYLSSQGFTITTDYIVTVEVGSGGQVVIYFQIKHDPTTDWVGIKTSNASLAWNPDGGLGVATPNTGTSTIWAATPTFNAMLTSPCATGADKEGTIPAFGLASSSSYNQVVFTSTSIVITPTTSTNASCDMVELTAVTSGTCPSPTYVWAPSAETTQVIYVLAGSGLHEVDVDCTECVVEDDITV